MYLRHTVLIPYRCGPSRTAEPRQVWNSGYYTRVAILGRSLAALSRFPYCDPDSARCWSLAGLQSAFSVGRLDPEPWPFGGAMLAGAGAEDRMIHRMSILPSRQGVLQPLCQTCSTMVCSNGFSNRALASLPGWCMFVMQIWCAPCAPLHTTQQAKNH